MGRTLEELGRQQHSDQDGLQIVRELQRELERQEIVKTLSKETREFHSAIGKFGKVSQWQF